MGIHEGRGHIGKAMKDLMTRWAETKGEWRDVMSEAFEKDHVVPLEMDVRNALGAMEHMAQILAQVKRDCE